MKKQFQIIMLAVFLLVSTTVSFGQNVKPAPQAKNDVPTLQATLAWLKDKLTANATFSPDSAANEKMQIVFGFEPIRFTDCDIAWKQSIGITGAGIPSSGSKVSLSLSDIDVSKIILTPAGKWKDARSLNLSTTNNKPAIKIQSLTSKGEGDSITDASSHIIHIKDEEIGNRIVKALTHIIKQCQSQKEPF